MEETEQHETRICLKRNLIFEDDHDIEQSNIETIEQSHIQPIEQSNIQSSVQTNSQSIEQTDIPQPNREIQFRFATSPDSMKVCISSKVSSYIDKYHSRKPRAMMKINSGVLSGTLFTSSLDGFYF